MIAAAIVGVAVAAPEVDVLYEHLALSTARVTTFSETGPVGAASQVRTFPEDRFDLGLAVELLWEQPSHEELLASLGVRTYRTHLPPEATTFDATVTDLRAGMGLHSWFSHDEPGIDGYILFTGGGALSVLSLPPWPTTLVPALNGAFAIGLSNRRGRGRIRGELRVSATLRTDRFSGRAQLPEEALIWHHYPGSMAISLLVGAGLRPGA